MGDALIELFVPGVPEPQPRPRFKVLPGGRVMTFEPTKGPSAQWKASIKLEAKINKARTKAPCLDVPLWGEFLFIMPRPKSKPAREKLPAVKPDLDNMLKAVKDSLEGVFYSNDSRICRITMDKVYAIPGETTGVKIRLGVMGETG